MICTREQLRRLYALPGERARHKQLAQLDAHCLRFISLSPFCVIASGGGPGTLLDASPRGGAPGFVKATDACTLLLPDAGGNNRLDTLENLLQDPRIGLLFMLPGVDETLRVNGTARLRDESEFSDRFHQEQQRPKVVIEVHVTEAYLHCAKAFMRPRLWHGDAKIDRALLPSMNQMISDQMGQGAATESQTEMVQRYERLLTAER